MLTVEQSVKAQFAKVFQTSDWQLFKRIGEANIREAAYVKKSDMHVESSLRLLARNCRKRLLVGVGVELLLKAVYLKTGYCINKPRDSRKALTFPFRHTDAVGTTLVDDQTFELNELIQHLPKVVQMHDQAVTLKGLRIAKVFRNKEGHGVTRRHAFDASNYRDMETSLIELYRDAFSERLSVRFSLAPSESALWRISRPNVAAPDGLVQRRR